MPFESNTETEGISVMRGSIRVLVEVVLFQLRGRGHLQDDGTPIFFPYSKGSLLGLSNELSFVFECFYKDGKKAKVFSRKLAVPRYMSTRVILEIL